MEYQKIINLLGKALNDPTKFRTKNWFEKNYYSCGTYSTGIQIKSETSMLKSSWCGYSDAYILVSKTISVSNTKA